MNIQKQSFVMDEGRVITYFWMLLSGHCFNRPMYVFFDSFIDIYVWVQIVSSDQCMILIITYKENSLKDVLIFFFMDQFKGCVDFFSSRLRLL